MLIIDNKDNWYALFVESSQEHTVKKHLESNLGETFSFLIPERELKERRQGKWHVVKRKLFPSYVLLKGPLDINAYYKIKETPHLIKVLKNNDEFLKIDEDELHVLNILTKKTSGKIGFSTLHKIDDHIKVVDGPLLGLEGQIVKVNARKHRAKVRLRFLNEERIVELGINVIEKI